jgi:hypothetical protein
MGRRDFPVAILAMVTALRTSIPAANPEIRSDERFSRVRCAPDGDQSR